MAGSAVEIASSVWPMAGPAVCLAAQLAIVEVVSTSALALVVSMESSRRLVSGTTWSLGEASPASWQLCGPGQRRVEWSVERQRAQGRNGQLLLWSVL